MAKVEWKDLTKDEREWLRRLGRGPGASLMLTTQMADRLKSLGLAEQKLGGIGLSKEGKRLIDHLVLAARRARGEI